jgi:PKD repeat protein
LTIPAGSGSGTIVVLLIDDGVSESVETFTVDLSNPVNATVTDNQGEGTITDNESLEVLRGPYLQISTPSSIIVKWRTNRLVNSVVQYGTESGNLDQTTNDLGLKTEHELKIIELLPDSKYYYSIGTTSAILAGEDTTHFFVTSPLPGITKPTRIWILGDSGTKNDEARSVRDAYYNFTGNRHTDLWLMLGDNAYNDGTDAEYQLAIFENMYEKMLQKSVLFPTLGNHDTHTLSNPGPYPYYDIFTLPENGEAGGVASGTEAYYSFDYGNIHFICLNSDESDLRSPGSVMWNWLQSDLALNDKDWTIAYWHRPPYTKGSHDSDTESGIIEMREQSLPLLEDAGIDLVLSGHSHSYERSYRIDSHYGSSSSLTNNMIMNQGDGKDDGDGAYEKPTIGPAPHEGTVYLVAGSSGKLSTGTFDHPVMTTSLEERGSLVLDIDDIQLNAKFLDISGNIRDYFTIIKSGALVSNFSGNPLSGIAPLQVDFTDLSAGTATGYSWDFGDGGTSSDQNPSYIYNTAGVYTVSLIVSDLEGSSSKSKLDYITVYDNAPPLTVSFQDGVNSYNGTRDTKLLSNSPGSNYGSATTLGTDGSPDESALYFWDLTSIPVGSSIRSVDITLNVEGKSSDDYEFYQMQRPWIENEVNWNQFASGQSWQVPGASGNADKSTIVVGSISAPVTGIYTIPLNAAGESMVQSWVDNPPSNHGIIILDYINASDGLDLTSRETNIAANRPKLTVTYSGSTNPSITVSSPNGGEQWEVGSIHTITWVSSNNQDNIDIEYSTDNGVTWQLIVTNTPDDGSESWIIPNTISNNVFIRIGDINSTITDQNDSTFSIIVPPLPSISIDDVTLNEGNTGTVDASFTLTLSPATAQTVTVNYSTFDSTATAGDDFVPLSGQLSIAPGDTSILLTVQVKGDTVIEGNENFILNLSNASSNAMINKGQGLGTITNDDGLPSTVTVSFQDGVSGYNGTRDTKILSSNPSSNYGSSFELGTDGSPDESAFIYWDISSIPVGSSVLSVDITVNVVGRSNDNYELYQMQAPWIENEATWNEYASGQSWEVVGATGISDKSSIVLGSIGAPTNGVYTISLNADGIAVVQSWVDDPGSNQGFIILDYNDASDGMDLSSREVSNVAERPILRISYSNILSKTAKNEDLSIPILLPEAIELHSNYPNPFNLVTTIDYTLHIDLPVQITIYNIRGQKVRTLIDEMQPAGLKTVVWNGVDDSGNVVSSGIYFIQLLAGENRFVHKMILQK